MRTNTSGSRSERSTWLSAAKWTTWSQPVHGRPHRVAVADVAVHEAEARVVLEIGQVLAVAGVGEGVEHDDRVVGGRENVADEVGADESGGARDEQFHGSAS